MKQKPAYTEFQPRLYRPRISFYWYLERWHYLKFMLRELSSVFVGYFVVVTLFQIRALAQGSEAYQAFQTMMAAPLFVILNVVSLLFTLFHTITWFNLTPSAMVVRIKGKRLPDVLVAGPNYVAWVVLSIVIAWIVIGG